MPSGDALESSWLARHQKELLEFSAQIEQCIADSGWENLTKVLELRQQYLERLLADPIPDCFLNDIKHLVTSVLEQDAVFLGKVQEQKNISAQQQFSLERGLQAVRAYNSNL